MTVTLLPQWMHLTRVDHETDERDLEIRANVDIVGNITQNGLPLGGSAPDLTPYIKKDGSRPFEGAQSMGGYKLIEVADPEAGTDAAPAAWVQNEIANAISGSGGGEAVQGSFIVSGGQVTWESAYTFRVSAASYYINGVLFNSAEQVVTLDAAHATLDRIDVLAVNDAGAVVKITGTAAAQPSEPDVDPSTELKLAFVLVTANTTQPAAVANTTVYANNGGTGGGEWDWTTSGSGFNVNSTNNPRNGTKCIEGTNVANNAYAQAQAGATFDPNSKDVFVFYIRSKAAFNANRVLRVQLQNAGVRKGNVLTVADGFFGFDSSNVTDYQQVAIPIVQFAVPGGTVINQVRFTDSGGALGFYIDDVSFQVGAISQTGTGITQAQADARYLKQGSNLSDLASLATAIANLGILTAQINAQTGTTYTLQSSDKGKIVTLDNASPITVTVPSGLGAGFSCLCIQINTGQVSFSGSGATVNNRQGHSKIAGRWGIVPIMAVVANTFVLGGDTAT